MPDQPLTRASVQTAISTKLADLRQLNDVLNVEIYELAGRAETAEAELAKYVGWEPTVKEEYEHACAERDAAEKDIAVLARVRVAAAKLRGDHDFDVSEWAQGVRFALEAIETVLNGDGAE